MKDRCTSSDCDNNLEYELGERCEGNVVGWRKEVFLETHDVLSRSIYSELRQGDCTESKQVNSCFAITKSEITKSRLPHTINLHVELLYWKNILTLACLQTIVHISKNVRAPSHTDLLYLFPVAIYSIHLFGFPTQPWHYNREIYNCMILFYVMFSWVREAQK